jgi:hypothetical protein
LVPPPGDIVQLVKDTAAAAVDKVTTLAGQPGKPPTSGPDREPAANHPAVHLAVRTAHAPRPAAAAALGSWSIPMGGGMAAVLADMPPTMAAPAVQTPAVAGQAAPSSASSHVADAAPSMPSDGPAGGILRAVLIALSAASAAALAYGHVAFARTR